MDIQAVLQWIWVALPSIVAIGWSVEKILRVLDKLLPANVTVDNNIADILVNILTTAGGIIKKK